MESYEVTTDGWMFYGPQAEEEEIDQKECYFLGVVVAETGTIGRPHCSHSHKQGQDLGLAHQSKVHVR